MFSIHAITEGEGAFVVAHWTLVLVQQGGE
jgi:hypothetical protein